MNCSTCWNIYYMWQKGSEKKRQRKWNSVEEETRQRCEQDGEGNKWREWKINK